MTDAELIRYWEALCDLIVDDDFNRPGAIQEAARMTCVDRTPPTLH